MLALAGSIQLCVSGAVYAEYEEVIRHSGFQRSEEIIAGTLGAIREKGLWVRQRSVSPPARTRMTTYFWNAR